MGLLNSIQNAERILYHDNLCSDDFDKKATLLNTLTTQYVYESKPKAKPAEMCKRMLELEAQYGMHSYHKPVSF